MSVPFNSQSGLVVVEAEVEGPAGRVRCSVAVDTGAVATVIDGVILLIAGIDPALAQQNIQAATAGGIVIAPQLPVPRLVALGQTSISFPVIALTLPPQVGVDGMIGLDFYRGQTLKIDFRTGLIDLT
jgi:aspartyl protease family protein